MTKAVDTIDPPPPPDNWYDVGWQHFLIGKHMPDRMAHQYPTQDRFTPGDETQFIAGWHAAKAADELAREGGAAVFD